MTGSISRMGKSILAGLLFISLIFTAQSVFAMPQAEETKVPDSQPAAVSTEVVPLESLQAVGSLSRIEADLPKLEYYSFKLDTASYVSVSVESRTGAAVSLADRDRGVFMRSGRVGEKDGRIDTLLDPGEYRVEVSTATPQETGRISVSKFREVETHQDLLMNSSTGTLQSLSLGDSQQRSYWVEVTGDTGLVDIEAAGRALHSVSIWKDGVWVIPFQPSVGEYDMGEGRMMGYVQGTYELEPGNYLFTFYGGAPRVWAKDSPENPFYVRFGAENLGSVVDEDIVISGMGRSAYLVSGDATRFEIEDPDFSGTILSVSRYGEGNDRYRRESSASVERESGSIRDGFSVSRNRYGERWLVVSGVPGKSVHIRAIPARSQYEIDQPSSRSQYLISTISQLSADHAVDATPLIYRNATSARRSEVIRTEPIQVSRQNPLFREVNGPGPFSFIVNIEQGGRWGLVHNSPDNEPIQIQLSPIRELSQNPNPDAIIENPAGFNVEPGLYILYVNLRRPDSLKFQFYYRGTISLLNDNNARRALEGPAPAPREDISYITDAGQISSGYDYTVSMNNRGGIESALFVEKLPLDFSEPVPLTIEAGGTLTIPVNLSAPGVVAGTDPAIGFSVGSRSGEGELTLRTGPSSLVLTNRGDTSSTFVLRFNPGFEGHFVSPALPEITSLFPHLVPDETLFYDYSRNTPRQFILTVDRPGFYELQTTGRLSTSIVTRTPANPRGGSASSNGPGRNALIMAYFRTGTYLVSVSPRQESEGRAGLKMALLDTLDLGRLTEGELQRTNVPAGTGIVSRAIISRAGRFQFQTMGLYGQMNTRLEDADGWPVSSAQLDPGLYRYYSWPQTVNNRRLTGYFRQPGTVEPGADEIWPLPANSSSQRTWNESEGRTPQRFSVSSPADLPVNLRISSAMEWWISDSRGTRVAEGLGNGSFTLPRGDFVISVRSKMENNELGYSISLSTSTLADGLPRQVSRSGSRTPVSIGTPGIYEFWSIGTWDVEATLNQDGRVLAEGYDRPGDWNFYFSRYLEPGDYYIRVAESFPGNSRSTVIYCNLREEIQTEEKTLPLTANIQLDRRIVSIPFTQAQDSMVRLESDANAVSMSLYRGSSLIGEGSGSFIAVLEGGVQYTLRLRSDVLEPQSVDISATVLDAGLSDWNGSDPISVSPGARVINNPRGVSVSTVVPSGSFLMSNNTDQVLSVPQTGIVSNQEGRLWTWYEGGKEGSTVTLRPLTLVPDRAVPVDINDDDMSAVIDTDSDCVYLVEARSISGYLGIMAGEFPFTPVLRDWTEADMLKSSSIIGLRGSGSARQFWIWDGAPGAVSRRIELVAEEFSLGDELVLDGSTTISLQPGEARFLQTGRLDSVHLLLSPDVVAFTSGSITTGTRATRGENRSVYMKGNSTLYLVNRGDSEGIARIDGAPASEALKLTPASAVETLLSAPAVVSIQTAPGSNARAAGKTIGVWAEQPGHIVLLTDDGRMIPADPPVNGRPYWSFPALGGEIRVEAQAGPVAAWIQDEAAGMGSWISDKASNKGTLVPGETAVSDSAEIRRFTLDKTSFVILATENRGVTVLNSAAGRGSAADSSGSASGDEKVAIGAGESRKIIAILDPGTYEVLTSPLAGEAQPGYLNFRVLETVPISEGLDPPTLFLDAGEAAVFSVIIQEDTPVGIGLTAEEDNFTTSLIDENLNLLGTGRLYYRALEPGNYYFLVENGSSPMRVRPVVFADEGSRTGIPEAVRENYRGDAQ